MTTKPTRRGRTRIQPWVKTELVQRLEGLAAARGVTEVSIVEEALREYFDDSGDAKVILRRLDRQGKALQRAQRDIELFSEAFALWVKIVFGHMAAIPEERKAAARQLSESRYRAFVEHVAEQFGGGKRFVDDLPRGAIRDGDEAIAGARKASA